MAQKTIEGEELSKIMNLGIECFVKVVSNKVDEAKEDIRSICLNFDPQVGDGEDRTRIGTGNNLNINNVKPGQYAALCKALGVEALTEDTAIVAVIYKPSDKAKLEAWATARARQEQDIPPDQTDISEFETPKQEAIRKGNENQKRIPDKALQTDTAADKMPHKKRGRKPKE